MLNYVWVVEIEGWQTLDLLDKTRKTWLYFTALSYALSGRGDKGPCCPLWDDSDLRNLIVGIHSANSFLGTGPLGRGLRYNLWNDEHRQRAC